MMTNSVAKLSQRIRYALQTIVMEMSIWRYRLRRSVSFTGTLLHLSLPKPATQHVALVEAHMYGRKVLQVELRITSRAVDRILAIERRQLNFTVRRGTIVNVRPWNLLDRINRREIESEE